MALACIECVYFKKKSAAGFIPPSLRLHGKVGHMLKVLIAEDNVLLADIIEGYLISRGYDVCGLAGSVDEAVALTDLHRPDLAVLDFRLRDGEYGSQVPARLKDKNATGILYASGDPLKGRLTREDGEAYIQKPYAMSELACALDIVHKIKTGCRVFPTHFPKKFHVLDAPISRRRQSA